MAAASPWRGRRSTARTPATSSCRAERLGDVVVRAQFESDQLVGLVRACGEHDHVDRRGAPDLAQHVEAADARQSQVEHDQVGNTLSEAGERLVAVDRLVDLESLAAENEPTRSRMAASSSTTRIRW